MLHHVQSFNKLKKIFIDLVVRVIFSYDKGEF